MRKSYAFHEIVSKTKKIRGIKSQEYQSSGEYPVVDQGNKKIAGFSDNKDVLYKDSLPVVVFGDHTRSIKYINFQFCVGADGTQILKPNENIITARFLYYSILNLNIQSLGYSRHFKLLKEATFNLPSIDEQNNITNLLDVADALRKNRHESIRNLDSYLEATFFKMFGDPMAKTKFTKKQFNGFTKRITYGFTSPMKHIDFGIPILTAKNVKSGSLDLVNVDYADAGEFEALTSKCKPKKLDILITKDGTIGRTALVDIDMTICINQSVALIEPDLSKVNPIYLVSYLNFPSVQRTIQQMGKGNAIKHLQITELAKFPIGDAPLPLQNKYALIVQDTHALQQKMVMQSEEFENQFQSLMQKAFNC